MWPIAAAIKKFCKWKLTGAAVNSSKKFPHFSTLSCTSQFWCFWHLLFPHPCVLYHFLCYSSKDVIFIDYTLNNIHCLTYLPPELEPHAHPTLDSASGHLGQTNVSASLESSGSYVFNNLESSGSEMDTFNSPGSIEGSSSSLPYNSGPMIIDLDSPHTGGSSFNADTQHSNTSAVTSFQFIDVDREEASGAHSSNEPKWPWGQPKLVELCAKSKGK